MYDNVVGAQLSEDESVQLCHLRSAKERLEKDIQEIREEILIVTQRISELQSEVEKNSDLRRPEFREAVDLFNDAKFKECFEQLLNCNVIEANDDCKGKASFLSSNIHYINKEMFHKYLFKAENQEVMQSFIHAISFEGLSLLDTVRKCFRELSFVEAEADIITRIYKYTSESYYSQNREEAEKHFDTLDACEFAAGAIVFINTTINNPNVKEKDKMSEETFAEIGTSKEISPKGIAREYMTNVYREVKRNPIQLNFSSNNADSRPVLKQGYLQKEGGRYKTWKKRWFVLHSDYLYYYVNPEDLQPRGIILLQNLEVRVDNNINKPHCFELVDAARGNQKPNVIKATKTEKGSHVEGRHSKYLMSASCDEERDEWIKAIKDTLKVDMVYALLYWRETNRANQQQSNF